MHILTAHTQQGVSPLQPTLFPITPESTHTTLYGILVGLQSRLKSR